LNIKHIANIKIPTLSSKHLDQSLPENDPN